MKQLKQLTKIQKYKFSNNSRRQEIELLKNNYCNIPEKILEKVDKKLFQKKDHPLGIIVEEIKRFLREDNQIKSEFQKKHNIKYQIIDNISPIVSTTQNFDELLVPSDHVSRKKSETYYINEGHLLRAHTSAHQKQTILSGADSFMIVGDVYRRDTIDSTHYPIFHQMELVSIYQDSLFHQELNYEQKMQIVIQDLQTTIQNLIKFLFKDPDLQFRWIDAYFPFTLPSYEMEIFYEGQWMEVLGCGIIHQTLMQDCNKTQHIGWAAGLGIERFAMNLFKIPDIRLFWSEDERFLKQFKQGKVNIYESFSKYPICYKDISFWVNKDQEIEENDLMEIVRNVAGDLVEKVECIDVFTNHKTNRISKCFRISYRSLERTLLNEEIDAFQFRIRDLIRDQLKVDLR